MNLKKVRAVVLIGVMVLILSSISMTSGQKQFLSTGFSYFDIDAYPDDPVYQQVPFPYNSNNILALCTLTHYLPEGDNDMGAICGYENWDWTNRQLTFIARTYDSESGFARFRAVLIDLDIYNMVDGLFFVIKDGSTYVNYQNQEYDIQNPAVFNLNNYDTDFVPIISVIEYAPNGDDDFNYSIQFEEYNQVTFNGFNGNDGSYASGYVYILKPNYANANQYDMAVTWGQMTSFNDQEYTQIIPLAYHDHESRMGIPTLSKYIPGSADDFWAYGLVNLWTTPEQAYMEAGGGDASSTAGYLYSVLTIWP
jgi:hypothetical protein